MPKIAAFFFSLSLLFATSAQGISRVENCIANGQFSTEKSEAVKKCAERTTMSLKDCQAQVRCFGPISFCMTGSTTGDSLESVIAQCSRTKSAAECENSLKCFANVSSCKANGQSGSTAEEALSHCVFASRMSRAQCLQSLDCQQEEYPMHPRPTPSTLRHSTSPKSEKSAH